MGNTADPRGAAQGSGAVGLALENPVQAQALMETVFAPSATVLHELYRRLQAAYGRQAWWPADSPFEVVVGAVLTQNAAWSNVERAIANLKGRELLSLPAILAATHEQLADAIRPSGYFNIKAKRLRSVCQFLHVQGGLEAFVTGTLPRQRDELLGVHGVGPETADDILLYALDRPVFVIDTYTRRLLARLRLARGDEPYEELRAGFEAVLGDDVELYRQYHALIVVHAKAACRKQPACSGCRLVDGCPQGLGRGDPDDALST